MTVDAQSRVDPEDVTLADTKAAASGPYKHLYVGVGGDVLIVTNGGFGTTPELTTEFKNVPAGLTLWDVNCKYVRDTGTTASSIVGYK